MQCRTGHEPILLRNRADSGPAASSHRSSPGAHSAEFVRAIIKARSARRQFFDERLFADPAWDMLLELYALNCEGRRVSVSKLSVAAGVPGTTGLRWIDKLEAEGLIVREGDPLDGRRFWIELSEFGAMTMRLYFDQIPVRQSQQV